MSTTEARSQWQIDQANEKDRKAACIREFAAVIGGRAVENDYDGPCEVKATIGGAPIEFRPDWHKRRWRVCVVAPRCPDGTYVYIHGDPIPDVSVSMDRPADAILADVRRRLVPAALAWLEKANARADANAKHEAAIVASMDALRAAAKAAGLKCSECTYNKRAPGCDGTMFVGGSVVRVSANWYQIERPTWDKAEAVAAAIASMGKDGDE